ncbi:hypothetical protein M9Y10_045313 [Tritrichomonas musculus]|uniref:Uncharacterized protein n=1 Tax=Tritrichomonas musculus TaxID=1915356 RepID=A0ABR2JUW0_9EUKA
MLVCNSVQKHPNLFARFNCSKPKVKFDLIHIKQSLLSNLRDDTKEISIEFPILGLNTFLEHCGDYIYDIGMKITDERELHEFISTIKKDINTFHQQVENWSTKEIVYLSDFKQDYKKLKNTLN